MDKLAVEKEVEGNVVEAKKIAQMKIQEETRIIHGNVKIATNDFLGAPYQMKLNTNPNPNISTDKDNIKKALIVEYDAKYRLANSSPF